MKRFLLGLLLGVFLCAAVPLLLLAFGGFNVAASNDPGAMEVMLAAWARERSIQRRATEAESPFGDNRTALTTGMELYRESCVMCHGAPDEEAAKFAEGFNPAPPPTEGDEIQKMSDGELFWVIENGIRMSGMPSFYDTYEEDEIWKIVTFIRRLPRLTEEEMESLGSIGEPGDDFEKTDEAPEDDLQKL